MESQLINIYIILACIFHVGYNLSAHFRWDVVVSYRVIHLQEIFP
jgi:hypothetical protein